MYVYIYIYMYGVTVTGGVISHRRGNNGDTNTHIYDVILD